MRKDVFIFALVLALYVTPNAHAQENYIKEPTKRGEKVLEVLDRMGIADPRLNNLIETVDAKTHNGYLFLAEERIGEGNLALRYDTGGLRLRQLELAYTPDEGNYQIRANSRGVMFNYRIELK